MIERKKLFAYGVSCFLLSTYCIAPLSQPILNPLIICLGNSQSEQIAVDTLQAEIPGAMVVEYNSLPHALMKVRAYGPVVYVAHGTEEGLNARGAFVDSASVITEINVLCASSVFLLACESGAIAELDESGRTFGYKTQIDAELAAMDIAIRVALSFGNIEAALTTYDRFITLVGQKFTGQRPIIPLRIIGGGGGGGGSSGPSLSQAELINAAYIFGTGCFFAFIGIGIAAALGKIGGAIASRFSKLSQVSGPLGNLLSMLKSGAKSGISSLQGLINVIFGGIPAMAATWLGITVDALAIWISRMNIFEWAYFLTLTSLEVILLILTAGMSALIRLEAGIFIAAMNALVIAISDYHDSNDVPCQSVFEAASQLCE